MKSKAKYLRHLFVEHWINLCVIFIATIVASSRVNCRDGLISVFVLCGIFLLNFFDHVNDHHKYKDFINSENKDDNGKVC